MDNEKKRASKLSKKGFASLKSNQHKSKNSQLKSLGNSSKNVKNDTKEFSLDIFNNCCEIAGVTVHSETNLIPLKKHINFLSHIIIQNALRFMEQSKRGFPQVCDVDSAVTLIGLETPRGISSGEYIPLKTGGRFSDNNSKTFYFKPDKEIDVKTLLFKEPSPVVYDISLVAHWLSINGKQPACPQNPSPAFVKQMNSFFGIESEAKKTSLEISDDNEKKNSEQNSSSGYHSKFIQTITEKRRPHEISQEVMVYFRELTEACVGAVEAKRQKALENVTIDTGLQPLLPHIVTFIAEGVRINVSNHNLAILIYLLRLIKALIDNPHISLEPHLHLLIPTIITCVLCKQLCAKPTTDNHWALRDFAAKQLVIISNKYSTASNNLYNRITREFTRVLCDWMASASNYNANSLSSTGSSSNLNQSLDVNKTEGEKSVTLPKVSSSMNLKNYPSFNTLYGILVVFLEFGGNCMRTLLFPLFSDLCNHLSNILVLPSSQLANSNIPDNVPLGQHLPPADFRSFESLKNLIVNRIGSVLHDYRKRNSMKMTLEEYKNDFKCLGQLLWNGYQTQLEKASMSHRPNAPPQPVSSAPQATPASLAQTPAVVTSTASSITQIKSNQVIKPGLITIPVSSSQTTTSSTIIKTNPVPVKTEPSTPHGT